MIAKSGHMRSHKWHDVHASGRVREGTPSALVSMALAGQKWLQMPHRLHRERFQVGLGFASWAEAGAVGAVLMSQV